MNRSTVAQNFINIFNRLIEAHPAITDPLIREQARFRSAVLLVIGSTITFIITILQLLGLLTIVTSSIAGQAVIFFVIGYIISRTRFHRAALVIMIGLIHAALYVPLYFLTDGQMITDDYIFFSGILATITALLVNYRTLIWIITGNFAFLMALVVIFDSQVPPNHHGTTNLVFYLVISSILIYRNFVNENQLKAMREGRRQLQAVLQNTPMTIAYLGTEGRVAFINRSEEPMDGLPIFDFIHADNIAQFRQTFAEAQRTKQSASYTGQTILANGMVRYYEAQLHPVIDRGEVTNLVFVALDLTERRQAEEKERRLQDQVIAAQQTLLAELATPLIPALPGVIVVPLIGSLDTARAREVTGKILEGISAYEAEVVMIDITGVAAIDSSVAAHLSKTFHAIRLRGARAVVTGIGDTVAETMVGLGVDWRGVEIYRSLQDGLSAFVSTERVK